MNYARSNGQILYLYTRLSNGITNSWRRFEDRSGTVTTQDK